MDNTNFSLWVGLASKATRTLGFIFTAIIPSSHVCRHTTEPVQQFCCFESSVWQPFVSLCLSHVCVYSFVNSLLSLLSESLRSRGAVVPNIFVLLTLTALSHLLSLFFILWLLQHNNKKKKRWSAWFKAFYPRTVIWSLVIFVFMRQHRVALIR